MSTATIGDDKLKKLLKSALVEVLEERRDLVQRIVEDVLEDIGLIRAIDQGLNGPSASRKQLNSNREMAKTPARAGKPWTLEEDEQLIVAFESGTPIRAIAEKHERTRGAIRARLVQLGKMTPRSASVRHDAMTTEEAPVKWWKAQGRTQAGKAWTNEEDQSLLEDFEAGISLEELAVRRRRGVRSVEVRLLKLGKSLP